MSLAEHEAAGILAEARAKAEERLAEARRELAARAAEIEARAEQRAATEERRIATQAELQARRDLLRAKVGLLDEVFAGAKRALVELPEEEWRGMMRRLLLDSAVSGTETLAVSAGQRERFAGLLPEINEELKKRGLRGELKLAPEPAAIESGFIMASRDYTVDCSVGTLIAERRAALEPEVGPAALWRLTRGPEANYLAKT